MYTSTFKKIILCLAVFVFGIGILFAQDSIPAVKEKKPLERKPFESGIAIDEQTVEIPPAKTLEFVLQHRFGSIQGGWQDLAGIWGASNIRLGLNFSITKNLLIGIGTTKNSRVQDLQLKYTFLHQRKGGFPLTIAYYGNFSINATKSSNFGYEYKFIDRFAYYHQFLIARRFCKIFSLQLGLAYSHFNKVDSTAKNDAFSFSLLGRIKVSPQTSILIAYEQPIVVNYDPAFIVRYPNSWMTFSTKSTPFPNIQLGVEIATSTHAFHIFIASAQGIVPSYVVQYNNNNFWNGGILVGLNITRLWGF
jgi:hypothetical protein